MLKFCNPNPGVIVHLASEVPPYLDFAHLDGLRHLFLQLLELVVNRDDSLFLHFFLARVGLSTTLQAFSPNLSYLLRPPVHRVSPTGLHYPQHGLVARSVYELRSCFDNCLYTSRFIRLLIQVGESISSLGNSAGELLVQLLRIPTRGIFGADSDSWSLF